MKRTKFLPVSRVFKTIQIIFKWSFNQYVTFHFQSSYKNLSQGNLAVTACLVVKNPARSGRDRSLLTAAALLHSFWQQKGALCLTDCWITNPVKISQDGGRWGQYDLFLCLKVYHYMGKNSKSWSRNIIILLLGDLDMQMCPSLYSNAHLNIYNKQSHKCSLKEELIL